MSPAFFHKYNVPRLYKLLFTFNIPLPLAIYDVPPLIPIRVIMKSVSVILVMAAIFCITPGCIDRQQQHKKLLEANKALVMRTHDEVWSKGNLDLIDELAALPVALGGHGLDPLSKHLNFDAQDTVFMSFL